MLIALLYLILAAALASLLDIDILTALADLFAAASHMMTVMATLPYAAYLDATPEILTSLVSTTRSRLSLACYFIGLITTPSLAPFVLLLLGGMLATAICDLLLWVFWIPRSCWKIIRWSIQSPLLLTVILLAIYGLSFQPGRPLALTTEPVPAPALPGWIIAAEGIQRRVLERMGVAQDDAMRPID